MGQQHTVDSAMEPTVRALNQLSPQAQEIAKSLVRQLAEREGITVTLSAAQGLQTPIERVPMWVAKLKAERYSPRTIHMYQYLVRHYLKQNPVPTKFELQSYLAYTLLNYLWMHPLFERQ